MFVPQDGVPLPFLQLVPCGEGARRGLLSLHEMQLLPRNEARGAQVPGEEPGDELPHLLRLSVHIERSSEGPTLRPLHALGLFSGPSAIAHPFFFSFPSPSSPAFSHVNWPQAD